MLEFNFSLKLNSRSNPMDLIPRDQIFEILKYIKIRQLKHVALLSRQLNEFCQMHIQTRHILPTKIQIGNGSQHIKVFCDDELSDMYDFFSKRVFDDVYFVRCESNCRDSFSSNCFNPKILSNIQLPFPLSSYTKITFSLPGLPCIQNMIRIDRCCSECCIAYNWYIYINNCQVCGYDYCDTCDPMRDCSECGQSLCYQCEANCISCGRGDYCENCLYNSYELCWRCRLN